MTASANVVGGWVDGMASTCESSTHSVNAHRADGAACHCGESSNSDREQDRAVVLPQTTWSPENRRGLNHLGTRAEHGKPVSLPLGKRAARRADGDAGTGSRRKRMPPCNEVDTGRVPGAKASRLPRGLSSRENMAKRFGEKGR